MTLNSKCKEVDDKLLNIQSENTFHSLCMYFMSNEVDYKVIINNLFYFSLYSKQTWSMWQIGRLYSGRQGARVLYEKDQEQES